MRQYAGYEGSQLSMESIRIGLVPLVMKQIQTLIYMLPQVETWYNLVLLPWLQDTLAIDIKSLKLDIVTEGLAAEWKQAGGIISRVVKYATSSTMSLISTFGSMAMVPVVALNFPSAALVCLATVGKRDLKPCMASQP